MAFKGTASKSSSGASMSKYDVEVEARLQALEKDAHPVPTGATQKKVNDRLAALEAKCGSGGGGDADLAERVSISEAVLRKDPRLSFDKLAAKERAERG